MVATFNVGQVAIIAVNTEDNGTPQRDLINLLLLAPADAGTVLYVTDRAWNGTAFAAAGSGDGTLTYTVGMGGLPAGSVITFTQAQLTAAGIDLSDAGETVYLYQGTSANAPTTFLHAVDIADGNTAANGSLVNTGLSYGTSAVAIGPDNAEFGTRTHDIQRSDLFAAINTATHWVQNDNSPQDGNAANTPTATAPDAQIWVAGSGAGEAIVTINLDGTYNSGTLGYQIVQAFQNDASLYHPSDISLDTVHDRYFFVDSDAAGHNRILQGSISQLLNNPGGALTTTVLYSNVGADANGIIQSLSVDTTNGIIYFDVGTDANGSTFNKIVYNTANQTPTVLATLGADHYVTQVAIDYAHGTVLLGTSQISSFFGDAISQNYVYKATGLTAGSTTLTFSELPFSPDDTGMGGEGSPLPGEAFPVELGTIRGIDIDPVTQIAYIATGSASLDNDGDGATTYRGGIYAYALTGNPTGTYTTLYQQNGTTGALGLLYYIEVDHATGRYYVVDESGTNADPGDGAVYSGSLTVPGTPAFLATVGNINGLGPRGLEIQHAPLLTGTGLAPTFTETVGTPSPMGTAVQPANAFNSTDADSGGDPNADELAGAQVRISAGFQSGGGHQDVLTINGAISGTVTQGNGDVINYSFNTANGVLTLSGASTLDNYEAMLALVRFRVDGDNPTNYGTATARTISYSTFDGLLYSDEITASVTVTGTNDAPINTLPATSTGAEDTNIVFTGATRLSVVDADADPASQPLQVTLSVLHGTLTLSGVAGLTFSAGDGTADATMTFTGTTTAINTALTSLTYTPLADYNGSDSLTFTTADQGSTGTGGAQSDSDTVTITINPVADIVADTATTNEDTQVSIPVQGNDTFENSGHVITGVTQGAHGTVAINDNGTAGNTADDYVTYNPVADYNGADSFTYTVTSGGVTETATVNVTVTAVADIVADTATTAEDTAVNVLVQGNETFENPGHVITANSQGAHGSVAINNNGTAGDTTDDYFVYTPTADYNGADSFTYTVTSGGVTETATATVTVSAVVDIANDSFTVNGTLGAATLNVLANDTFEAANPVITAKTNGAHGIVTIIDGPDADGVNDYVSYTADALYAGPDSFTYTVTSGGVTETATVNLTVITANAAPTSTNLAGDTAAYIEQAAPVRLDVGGNATIADANSTDFAGGTLTVAITANGVAAEDVLGINQTAGVTTSGGNVLVGATVIGTYSGGTGGAPLAFALNSAATPSTVQTLVRSLEYSNTNAIAPSIAMRGVTITLNDGDGTADGGFDTLIVASSVTVTGVNDAPNGTDKTLTTVEDTQITVNASDFGFTDTDGNALASVRITSLPTGALLYDADGAGGGAAVAAATGTNYALTGGAYFLYTPALNANGTAIDSFGFRVRDDGGTANGGVDLDPVANTISFTVTPVNDAPTATNLSAPQTYFEDTTLNLTNIVVTDVDSTSVTATLTLSNAAAGALTTGTSGAVTSTYNASTGQWSASGAIADVNAVLASVSFAPAANFNANITIATSVSDGVAAPITGSIALTGTPVNDAPAGSNTTITTAEDTAVFVTAADFGFSDVRDGNNFVAVHIASLPTAGTLLFDVDGAGAGAPVAVTVGDYAITGNARFIYTPPADATGNNVGSFGFQVIDDGGTNNGGQNTDQSANTISFRATAVNDAPINSVPGAIQMVTEDATLVFSAANGNAITVSDVDAGANDISVTLGIGSGVLTLGGTVGLTTVTGNDSNSVVVVGTLANINTALNGLSYAPPANFNGNRTLTVTTSDLSNTGPGPALTDSDTVAITVSAVNDAPVVPDSPTITATEQTATVLNAGLVVSDVDLDARGAAGNYAGASFTIKGSTIAASDVFGFATSGGFSVVGNTLQAGGQTFANFSTGSGVLTINFVNSGPTPTTALVNDVFDHVQYTNTLDAPPASVGLIYALNDGAPGGGQGAVVGGSNIDSGQITVNLTAVNDAPTATIGAIGTATEQTALSLKGNLSVADVDAGGGTVVATLSADYGQITVTAGGSGAVVAGSGTGSVTITGTLAQVNALLNTDGASTVSYVADTDTPPASARLTLGIDDGGNTGTGGALTGSTTHAITITPLNDAPAGIDSAVTGSEDDSYVFLTTDFPFTDAEGNGLASVVITTLPSIGLLSLAGAPVAAGTSVTLAQIQAGSLSYLGAMDGFGSPYASFTFQVRDDGGTANGGIDLDASANTLTINLTPDNVAPVVDLNGAGAGINSNASYTEGLTPAAIGSGIVASDFNESIGDRIESVTVTLTDAIAGDNLSVSGSLPSGISMTTVDSGGQIVLTFTGAGIGSDYSSVLQQVRYSSTSQDPGAAGTALSRTITVVANDGDLDSVAATATITVIPVDDPAVARGDRFSTTELSSVSGNLFANNGSGADSDVDGPTLAIATINGMAGSVGHQITLASGALVTVQSNGSFTYSPNGAFQYVPSSASGASNFPGTDSFTYELTGGGSATVVFSISGVDNNDLLIGTAGANVLLGGAGNDVLNGLGGNDLLLGGIGADTMDGGNGDDTFVVDNAGDAIIEKTAGGNDTVYTDISYVLSAGAEVEILSTHVNADTAAINLTGNSVAQAIVGNYGNNVLTGGGGADTLIGLLGNDTYVVSDSATMIVEQAGGGTDTLYTSVSYALGDGQEIEILSTRDNAGTAALYLTGNSGSQTIVGNMGDNIINGLGGADTMIGLGGNDIYLVRGPGDTVIEANGGGFDTIYTTVSYNLGANEVEVLSTVDNSATTAINLTGNFVSQTLVGNYGDNILNGGSGADTLIGLRGNDLYAVGDSNIVVIENAGEGSDTVVTSVDYVLNTGANVEVLSAQNQASTIGLSLKGNEFAQLVYGTMGADTIDGGAGVDTLVGSGGDDMFAFSTALGAGNVDVIADFAPGTDRISLSSTVFTGLGLGTLSGDAFVAGTAALDANDRILYDRATGSLYFDADGNGAGAAILFASLTPNTDLTAGNLTVV